VDVVVAAVVVVVGFYCCVMRSQRGGGRGTAGAGIGSVPGGRQGIVQYRRSGDAMRCDVMHCDTIRQKVGLLTGYRT